MKKYKILKQFTDESGVHTPGDKDLYLSDNRALKLQNRGYVGSSVVVSELVVKLSVDSEEVKALLKKSTDALEIKNKTISNMKKHVEQIESENTELSRKNETSDARFDGFLSSIKSATTIGEVKAVLAALEKIEATK